MTTDLYNVCMDNENKLVVFDATPKYTEWCKALGLDPNDEENLNSYSEWKSNS